VLSEGDDQQDPIADASRAILDGHVVLSRRLAEEGHYPAIDIEASISRAMPQIVPQAYLQKAQLFKQLYARYQQSRDLISVGAYAAGSDPLTDKAMEKMPSMQGFLRQGLHESVSLTDSQTGLEQILGNE
jgi:flagellum-specific ATP synthase